MIFPCGCVLRENHGFMIHNIPRINNFLADSVLREYTIVYVYVYIYVCLYSERERENSSLPLIHI